MKSARPRHATPGLALLAVSLAAGLPSTPSRAQVSAEPTSILFDGEPGTKAITVTNTGKRTEVYRVSLINLNMLPDGRMVPAGTARADEHFADGMVRFSPHEVELAPGGSEVVRLKVASLRPGEYRTHVLVQQVPGVDALETSPFAHAEGVAVDLKAVFGVAIPLIIRQGELPTRVALSEARLTVLADGTPAASLRLERSGARSVRGAVSLLRDGKEIAAYDGIAVYAPAERRDLILPLTARDVAGLREGSLTATFQEPDDTRGALSATAQIRSTEPNLAH